MQNPISAQTLFKKARCIFYYILLLCTALLFLSVTAKAEGTSKSTEKESMAPEKVQTREGEQTMIAVNLGMIADYRGYMHDHSVEVITWDDFVDKDFQEMKNVVDRYNAATLRPIKRY